MLRTEALEISPSDAVDTGVSKNRGRPKSSILIGFSIISHPFGGTPIFLETPLSIDCRQDVLHAW